MSLFTGWVTISANDIVAATAWYKEKFVLKESSKDPEYTQLETQDREFVITLCSGAQEADEPPPIINTSSVAKAREWLAAHGVNVTPVQTDSQGTHYIEMRDLEKQSDRDCRGAVRPASTEPSQEPEANSQKPNPRFSATSTPLNPSNNLTISHSTLIIQLL